MEALLVQIEVGLQLLKQAGYLTQYLSQIVVVEGHWYSPDFEMSCTINLNYWKKPQVAGGPERARDMAAEAYSPQTAREGELFNRHHVGQKTVLPCPQVMARKRISVWSKEIKMTDSSCFLSVFETSSRESVPASNIERRAAPISGSLSYSEAQSTRRYPTWVTNE